MRWASTIENVLTMMNEPTNRAMNANASSAILMKLVNCPTAFALSAARSAKFPAAVSVRTVCA